jgi:tRNA A-37 threonylcarbamoyl transferase component Bud32
MNRIGKYEILDVLGKGAMGIVYRALDPDIDREVALKAIHFDSVRDDSTREELIKRFLGEGRAAGQLNHPNIVTIHDVGREGDLTYIVMQYVRGQSLQGLIDAGRTFTPAEVNRLMIPLLRAVEYAHRQGVIHRDIKPANILVDASGTPHLADFGIAKTAASTLTVSGTALGTPGYISPEQLQGQPVSSRADVFSLGVLLYVLLAGREPFARGELASVMKSIVRDEPPPPSRIKPDLSAGYDVVTARAMAKRPEDRYQSCAEMASALESLDREAVSTLTVKLGSETPAPRRHRLRLAVLVTSLVLLILGAAAAAVFVFRVFERSGETRSAAAVPAAPLRAASGSVPETSPDPAALKMADLRRAYAGNELEETARIAREVLALDPSRGEARDYLDRAERGLREAETRRLLGEAQAAYAAREYERSRTAAMEVLRTEAGNPEAIRLRDQAETRLAEAAVSRVLERQRRSEEEKDLVVLLSDVSGAEAAAARREEALLLFNYYDDLKSLISNVSYRFQDPAHVQVRFFHLVTGLYKKTGEKKVLVQDIQNWTLAKVGRDWKILSFRADQSPEAG